MQTNQDAPTFTIQLSTPTTAHRCIRCAQIISFAWDEIPVVGNRRTMHRIATFFAHPTVEACEAEIDRARRLDAGEIPTPYDIGLQRAALLRQLIDDAQAALIAREVKPEPEAQPDDGPNYAKRTRGSRERRGVRPYGGLL